MAGQLQDRTALVTGSTNGIGEAIAQALAAEGARVIVSGRDEAKGKEVVAAIEAAGGRADFVAADLTGGVSAVRELADAATGLAGGPLDILVNNAARLITPAPTAEVSAELLDEAWAVSVKAPFLLTGLLAPPMAARGYGAIVNLGSISGLEGTAHSALYGATKATMHHLTKAWADEFGPFGVRVNTVAPGPTLTAKVAGWADAIAPILAKSPSRRASQPAEVAAAVVFLVGDNAANIHGALLSVDGGYAAV